MSEKSKELFENMAEVLKGLPEEAAADVLSHATSRAEGFQAGMEFQRRRQEDPEKKEDNHENPEREGDPGPER